VLNNDRKIGLIEENAHGLQYAPGSTRMPTASSAIPFRPSRRADNIEFCDLISGCRRLADRSRSLSRSGATHIVRGQHWRRKWLQAL
jgi:hypothetical protein